MLQLASRFITHNNINKINKHNERQFTNSNYNNPRLKETFDKMQYRINQIKPEDITHMDSKEHDKLIKQLEDAAKRSLDSVY